MDDLFLPFEAQRIKSIPLCVTDQDDCLSWPRCRSGSYSVKISYQLLCEKEMSSLPSSSDSDGVRSFWKFIWHLKVPNKVKVFIWQACSRALPTKENLKKRNVVDSSVCDQCGCLKEDEVHAIWDYVRVHVVWESSYVDVRNKYLTVKNMWDLVSIMKAESKNMEVSVMSAWLIWLQRNKLRSNEATQPC